MSNCLQSIPSDYNLSSPVRPSIFDSDALSQDVRLAYEKIDGAISHQSLADSFKAFYPDYFGYDWNESRWYYFSVLTWIPKHTIMETIAEWVGVMLNRADASKTDRAKWLNSATYSSVETILKSALAVEFNWIKNLVAFQNGTAINTDTGMIEQIHARYHINKYLPDGINGDAKPSVEFDNIVWDCLSHFELEDRFKVKDFMQQFFGSALAGDCRDETMLFLNGPPATGKSTIVEPIAKVLGDYAASVYGAKVAKEGNAHLEWLARLENKRLVTITELPDKGTWQTDTLNDLIGGGVVSANFMRQNTREYVSVAHVVATGNSRPRAAGGSGIWRRIKIINFDHKPEKLDKGLKERFLTTEQNGIMAWLIEGLIAWLDNDRVLTTPAVIEADVQEYQESSEPVAQFIRQKCARGGSGNTVAADLYAAYSEWFTTQVGDKPVSKRRFGTILHELGIPPAESINKVRAYRGLEIVPNT